MVSLQQALNWYFPQNWVQVSQAGYSMGFKKHSGFQKLPLSPPVAFEYGLLETDWIEFFG
jgi:hypothetical protein